MRKFLLTFLCFLVWGTLSGVEAFPNFPAKVKGRMVMEFDLSQHQGKEVNLWVPYPVSNEYQTITNMKIEGTFSRFGVYTDNKYKTPILFVNWQGEAIKRKVLTLSFDAERVQAVKKDFPAEEPCWNPEDFKKWLQPYSLGPINQEIKALAKQITAGKTSVYEKVKAIYDWVCDNMYRDPKVKGCGLGDVQALLVKLGGKCTDIHSVFVILCRAAGIPAREIFGIRMGRGNEVTDITKWQHCFAEFFLPGYGWVPVDPADVLKMMLKRHLTLKDKETSLWRDYFWGAWDPYRIELARGRDIVLNPQQKGKPLNNFGYPYAEIDGQAIDSLDPDSFQYKFTFYPVNN